MDTNLITPVDLLLARREVALLRRENEIREQNQIYFYEPHPRQALFHSAANFYNRYARTGNRFGKSEMGAAEDVSYALGFRPWIPEGDPLRALGIPTHATKGLIVTTDWDKSTEVFTSIEPGANLGKLFKYIPASDVLSHSKNHSGAIDMIRVQHYRPDGKTKDSISVIQLDTVKSFKMNPLGQESSVWDWVHYDEPVPEQMFKAHVRGTIDRGGRIWFTCTPLEEPWIDAKFIPDLQDQSRLQVDVQHGDFWMMTGSTDDNPHNNVEDIERVMANYTEEERETRRSGIPAAYSGLVYKEFQWAVHVRKDAPIGWKSWAMPPDDYTIRFAIDYHPRKPHHVLFIATSPQEYHFIFAELFISCLMEELVADIRLSLGLREATVPGLIDPLSDTPNRVTDITSLEEILRLGLPVIPATKDPHNGILKVKALLKARDRAKNPILQVNPECRRFLYEISRGYIWDKETNKPIKKDDDAMENFYRLALQGLSYIEPEDFSHLVPIKSEIPSYDNIIAVDLSAFNAEPKKRSLAFSSRYRS